MPIPVIDLFAGPGGLSEGFAACRLPSGERAFRIALSIEKDPVAHQTLELRAFFRQFDPGHAPDDYYRHNRHPAELSRSTLFESHPAEAAAARSEAWKTELGVVSNDDVDHRIHRALGQTDCWVLIGGPPCQAYSLVGRSRRGGIDPTDHRVHLYQQYLRILAVHRPPFFVMENVTGLLSSRINGQSIFDTMLSDLATPESPVGGSRSRGSVRYNIRSFVTPPDKLSPDGSPAPRDYVIRCEDFGVPQARHRVILFGIRSDVKPTRVATLTPQPRLTVADVIGSLPRLRSGLSKTECASPLAVRRLPV